MDCQNLRREVDEAAPGDVLSAFASWHMTGCVECRTFNEQHHKLQNILSSLGTVEAPGDFDFRLRARLAGEKARGYHFPLSNISFGFRTAVVATLLVVFGAALFLSFNSSRDNSLSVNNVTPAAGVDGLQQPGAATLPNTDQLVAVDAIPEKVDKPIAPKRRLGSGQFGIASARNNSGMGTRDMGSRPAPVIRAADLNARAADFPIEASSQPMKVSLDNGRGSSRTISLPPVSFGSQRVLGQGATPLMASARGSW
ncbi:MAG: hypothetical protein AABN95_04700 [Acidobacteriota bacterium]